MAWWSTTKDAVTHVKKQIAAAWGNFSSAGSAVDRNAAAVAREYHRSLYLWTCINKIITTAAVAPLYVKTEKDRQLTAYEQQVQQVLDNPNPQWTQADLIEYVTLSLVTTMRAFILVIRGVGNTPIELWALDPAKVTVEYVSGTTTIKSFSYQPGNTKQVFPVNEDGSSDIIFLQRNSLNPCKASKSPAEVAVPAAEVFNRILQKAADIAGNASNITGVLSTASDVDQTSVEKVRDRLDDFKTGGSSSGATMVTANAEWKFTRMTEEPDSIISTEIKDSLARDICAVLGVPSQLVSIPGSQTYANYETAMLALVTETIIPMYLKPLISELTRALLRGAFNGSAQSRSSRIDFDIDAWPSLVRARLGLAETANKADFLSIDEQRELLGYPKLEIEEDGKLVLKVEKMKVERLKAEAAVGSAGLEEAPR